MPSLDLDRLDRVRATHPDMVLLHGGSPKGAELTIGDPAQGAADRLQAGLYEAQAVIVAALLTTRHAARLSLWP
jgi:hypothetical protein